MNKRIFLVFIILIITGILSVISFLQTIGREDYVLIGNTKVFVEIADTPSKRAQGLSGREKMDPDHGMLFVFEKEDYHPFWMKDMLIPLDFIWISKGEVVQFSKNVPFPLTSSEQPASVFPALPIDMVLEINSGFIDNYKINIGDKIEIVKKESIFSKK